MIKKLIISLAFVLAFTSQAFAQPIEVPQLRPVAAQSQSLLQLNTAASCYEFSRRVLAAINDPHWGHVGKTAGEGQYPLAGLGVRKGRDGNSYNVSGVSHDAIYFCANPDGRGGCNYGAGDWQIDLLGNGNDGPDPLGSPAIVQWNVIPQQYYRPGNPFIGVTNSPVPSPTPVSTPAPAPVDLSAINAALARLESAVAALADSQRAAELAVSEVDSKVTSVAARVEAVLTSNDRIVRQLLTPPTYSGRLSTTLTLKPTVTAVKP